jgi:hypothetical protein
MKRKATGLTTSNLIPIAKRESREKETKYEHDYQRWRTDNIRMKEDFGCQDMRMWIEESIMKIRKDLDLGNEDLIYVLEKTLKRS